MPFWLLSIIIIFILGPHHHHFCCAFFLSFFAGLWKNPSAHRPINKLPGGSSFNDLHYSCLDYFKVNENSPNIFIGFFKVHLLHWSLNFPMTCMIYPVINLILSPYPPLLFALFFLFNLLIKKADGVISGTTGSSHSIRASDEQALFMRIVQLLYLIRYDSRGFFVFWELIAYSFSCMTI